jgi:hypothetical protein
MARTRTPRESGPAVTHEKLVKLANADYGHSGAAAELGVPVGQISSIAWSRALVDAGRYDTAPATSASVKRLKDVEGNRWELIAARTGESVARVKELYGPDAGNAASPRGRKAEGDGATAGKKATTRGKGKAAAAATPRRARTRAERMASRSGNPS